MDTDKMTARMKHAARHALHVKLIKTFGAPVAVGLCEQDLHREHLDEYSTIKFVIKCSISNTEEWKHESVPPDEFFDDAFNTIIADVEQFANDKTIVIAIDAVVDAYQKKHVGAVGVNICVYVAYVLKHNNYMQRAFDAFCYGFRGDSNLKPILKGCVVGYGDAPFINTGAINPGAALVKLSFPVNNRDYDDFTKVLPLDLRKLIPMNLGRIPSSSPLADSVIMCSSIGAAQAEMDDLLAKCKVSAPHVKSFDVSISFVKNHCQPQDPVRFCHVIMHVAPVV